MTDKLIIGIDVSKGWLDIAVAGQPGLDRVANNMRAIEAWLARLEDVALVAFEPTGGYERALQDALCGHDIRFARVHPNQVIAFRKCRAIKAKTDRLDAHLIAAFAAEELLRRGFRPVTVGNQRLRELAARRRQLVDMRHAERCRLDLAHDKSVKSSLKRIIAVIERDLYAIKAKIQATINADDAAAELARLMQTVNGVGPVTAAT